MFVNIYGYQNESGRIVHYHDSLIRDGGNGCALELTVDIPDSLNPFIAVCGSVCIEVDGCTMQVNGLLFSDKNGDPWIKYPDMQNWKNVSRKLKVISENGWKNTHATL